MRRVWNDPSLSNKLYSCIKNHQNVLIHRIGNTVFSRWHGTDPIIGSAQFSTVKMTWYLFDDLDRRMFLHGKVIPNFQSVYKDEMKPIFFFYELYMLRDVQT